MSKIGRNIVVHPAGRLEIQQRVSPLDMTLKKVGSAKITGHDRFTINVGRDIGVDKKYRQRQLSAMDFLKGVRFDKGYIEPLIDDVYGVGSTYSGLYYVDKVTHSFTAGAYRQSFKLERNPTE